MKKNNLFYNWLILLIIISIFIIFNFPYRTPILSGLIIASLSYPMYRFLDQKLAFIFAKTSKILSAIITMFSITSVLFIAFNILTLHALRELPALIENGYDYILALPENENFVSFTSDFGYTKNDVQGIVDKIQQNVENGRNTKAINQYLEGENLNRIWNITRQTFDILITQLIHWIVFFIAWYNALIFGSKWVKNILSLFPFEKSEITDIVEYLIHGTRNVLYANILSAIIHTFITFGIMVFFNLPNVYLVSLIAFIIGFLPASPSEISYFIPVSLLIGNNFWLGVGVAIFAEIVILFINFYLIPRIILSGGDGNALFVITSILTGLSLFGVMGFLIGPVIMVLIITLWRIVFEKVHVGFNPEEEKARFIKTSFMDNLVKEGVKLFGDNKKI